MIKLSISNHESVVEQWVFPGGEVGVKLPMNPLAPMEQAYGILARDVRTVTLKASLQNSEDVMALMMAADAVRRRYTNASLELDIPYFPYARQDRVMMPGEALSVRVFARMINSCGFAKVRVLDAHSDVVGALLDNVTVKPQHEIKFLPKHSWNEYTIVAPDAGAYKKAYKFAEYNGCAGVVSATKIRDLATGEILETKINEDVTGKRLMIVDDIADGSRTFIELSKVLRPKAKSLELYVTHGIFSKGLEIVTECFDMVYSTNSFHPNAGGNRDWNGNFNDKVKWIKVI